MKLTLKQLKDLISSYRTALNEAENFERLGFDIRSNDIWYYLEHALDIALILYFGENVSEKVWNFILNDSLNEFATVEELFEFVSDKYSELVNKDTALTLDQLQTLFPQEEMFKYFDKVIKEQTKQKENETTI